MISYPPRSALALAYLKRPYNDIDIFVEDSSNHNMWLHIIRSLLPPGRHISSVNMLGGRNSVIEACRLDQTARSRSRLYIIDGDFDFLLGKSKPKLKHLYRIRSYCVENLLLKEKALIDIGLECKPTLTEAQIAAQLDLPSVMRHVDATLTSLFVAYAVAHQIAPEVKTVGYSVSKMVSDNGGFPELDRVKVRKRLVEIVREIVRAYGLNKFKAARREISTRLPSLKIDQVISGKDYILPLVLLRFRPVCGYRHGNENFKVAMARSFDRSNEPGLARRIAAL